ncbi:MAG: hypothetical protein CMK52_04410 [Proteobacteria bacterium]|nr:hypothetical protein [Pseudomonadota bacterium]
MQLNTTTNDGIIDYDPAELVVRVRSGTSIINLEKELVSKNQFLNFEPPRFKRKTKHGLEDRVGTVGGMIASGLSGPGRFFYGGCRESVLGLTILTVLGNYCGSEVLSLKTLQATMYPV